jgi:hypothetical protein
MEPEVGAKRDRRIHEAAEAISHRRLYQWLDDNSVRNGDYDILYEGGRAHHLNNGTRREVALMITARAGACILLGNKTGAGGFECQICGLGEREDETHLLLGCPGYAEFRADLLYEVKAGWSNDMRTEFEEAPPAKQRLILLGAHLEGQSKPERIRRDTAVKRFLIRVDDMRMHAYGMSSLRGTHGKLVEGPQPADVNEDEEYVEELQ